MLWMVYVFVSVKYSLKWMLVKIFTFPYEPFSLFVEKSKTANTNKKKEYTSNAIIYIAIDVSNPIESYKCLASK